MKNIKQHRVKKNMIKKHVRCIMIILLSCFIFITGTIFYLYFYASHIQNRIKEKVCAAVLKHQDDLLITIEECKGNQKEIVFCSNKNQGSETCCYKELKNKTVNKVFKEFRLAAIRCLKSGTVIFSVRPTVISNLKDTYLYGFYYTGGNQLECDAAIEGEEIIYGGKYWYKTEKIDDNWYFYEVKIIFYQWFKYMDKSKLL